MSTASRSTPAPASRLRPDKRAAILRAARTIFGSDGYSRASIDAIAVEAGVSTRTIYNHFESKEQLFTTVLKTSAGQVAEAVIGAIETSSRGVEGLEEALIALARPIASQRIDFPEHFAMVRQINAEAAHFPAATIAGWQQAGPQRVEREIIRRLQVLADAGTLRIAEPTQAAHHFIALITAEAATRSYVGPEPAAAEQTEKMTAAGVYAFLHGYAAEGRR